MRQRITSPLEAPAGSLVSLGRRWNVYPNFPPTHRQYFSSHRPNKIKHNHFVLSLYGIILKCIRCILARYDNYLELYTFFEITAEKAICSNVGMSGT